jgi:succinylglutamate desuccinylase
MPILPNNIHHFVGDKKGKCIVIMAGVHGNERVGVHVIQKLNTLLRQEEIIGEVYLILGNPDAYKNNVRFVDEDMNRLFGKETLEEIKKLSFKQLNVEQKRVLELLPILQKADFLLDIHSTINPSVPFVFTENTERHLRMAQCFDVEYIVCNSQNGPKDMNSCTDNFVDRNGGIGLTYESGWHKDEQCFENVLLKAKLFLAYTKATFLSLKPSPRKLQSKSLLLYKSIIPKSDKFYFLKKFKNFETVSAGTIIATDDKKEIYVEQNSYFLFVKNKIQKSQPACYLAFHNL